MNPKFQQASQLHQSGDLRQAEVLYNELLRESGEHPILLARLATLWSQTRRARESLSLFDKAIAQLGSDKALLQQAVLVASKVGRYDFAERWCSALVSLDSKDESALEQYAGILMASHQEAEALKIVKQLIQLNPNNASAYNLKGMTQSRMGESDKAYKSFLKALKLNPGQIGVIRNLLIHSKGKKEPALDALMPQFEQRLNAAKQDPLVKMNIAYVLSMYYEKQGKANHSFRYLKMGNDINRSTYDYSHDESVQQFGFLKSGLDDALVDACKSVQVNDVSPIFILGMPRSGTTLIEQILSSHSKVSGEGELETLRAAFEVDGDEILGDASSEQKANKLVQFANKYLQQVQALQTQRDGAPSVYFTDKMPYNFMLAGYIAAIMPNAKIIHCTRDPIETCFSIYKQNFSGSHAYTNDLTELGQYYNLYADLMADTTRRFPDGYMKQITKV